MDKYKISINDIEKRGMIKKFESDGVSREQLMKSVYKETTGMNQQDRTKIVQKLFDREYSKQD